MPATNKAQNNGKGNRIRQLGEGLDATITGGLNATEQLVKNHESTVRGDKNMSTQNKTCNTSNVAGDGNGLYQDGNGNISDVKANDTRVVHFGSNHETNAGEDGDDVVRGSLPNWWSWEWGMGVWERLKPMAGGGKGKVAK
ncbi:hypothetical protein B0T17DRAFT_618337 [Bombardia bombarda]|uniref:Uncharacterized protein n=1 Tax=Bombardia bombarda TaxID=252184 RepID=A0AA40C220_9PEZI|nr:hypothetical protein B0T17DRAFT_618337 [Bombardia bombarda]